MLANGDQIDVPNLAHMQAPGTSDYARTWRCFINEILLGFGLGVFATGVFAPRLVSIPIYALVHFVDEVLRRPRTTAKPQDP